MQCFNGALFALSNEKERKFRLTGFLKLIMNLFLFWGGIKKDLDEKA